MVSSQAVQELGGLWLTGSPEVKVFGRLTGRRGDDAARTGEVVGRRIHFCNLGMSIMARTVSPGPF